MSVHFTKARRAPVRIAARRGVSAFAIAIAIAIALVLGVVISHSTGAQTAHGLAATPGQPTADLAIHDAVEPVVLGVSVPQTHTGCLTCSDTPEGAMAACLMLLIGAIVVLSRPGAPTSWQTTAPRPHLPRVRQVYRHVPAPDLTVLGVCRT